VLTRLIPKCTFTVFKCTYTVYKDHVLNSRTMSLDISQCSQIKNNVFSRLLRTNSSIQEQCSQFKNNHVLNSRTTFSTKGQCSQFKNNVLNSRTINVLNLRKMFSIQVQCSQQCSWIVFSVYIRKPVKLL